MNDNNKKSLDNNEKDYYLCQELTGSADNISMTRNETKGNETMETLTKQQFIEAVKSDRLYGKTPDEAFEFFCEEHSGLMDSFDSGEVIRNGNDIFLTNGSRFRGDWDLIIEIQTN